MLLIGFVMLLIYGMIYRYWPTLANSPLATAQFWISAVSAVGIIIGSYIFATSGSVPLVALSSMLFIIGALLLTWLFVSKSDAIG